MRSKMLTLDDYKPVELEDKPIFDKHYEKYPPVHSDNVFTTLISWKEYADYYYAVLDKNLLIMSKIQGKIQLRPPSGKRNKEIFDQVLKLAVEQDSDFPVGVIDNDSREFMSNIYPKIDFIPMRSYFDYVYLASDLARLSGSAYSKIRNRLNKFRKSYEYTVEKIDESNISDVKKFLKRWCLWKDCESDPVLKYEKKAVFYSMEHFFDLGLSGLVVLIDDRVEAVSVYEKMNHDTVVVHYEKGSPYYDGIYKVVNQETAKIVEKIAKYINRESDLGIPGLRNAKMSYRPHHMVEIYSLKKEEIFDILF